MKKIIYAGLIFFALFLFNPVCFANPIIFETTFMDDIVDIFFMPVVAIDLLGLFLLLIILLPFYRKESVSFKKKFLIGFILQLLFLILGTYISCAMLASDMRDVPIWIFFPFFCKNALFHFFLLFLSIFFVLLPLRIEKKEHKRIIRLSIIFAVLFFVFAFLSWLKLRGFELLFRAVYPFALLLIPINFCGIVCKYARQQNILKKYRIFLRFILLPFFIGWGCCLFIFFQRVIPPEIEWEFMDPCLPEDIQYGSTMADSFETARNYEKIIDDIRKTEDYRKCRKEICEKYGGAFYDEKLHCFPKEHVKFWNCHTGEDCQKKETERYDKAYKKSCKKRGLGFKKDYHNQRGCYSSIGACVIQICEEKGLHWVYENKGKEDAVICIDSDETSGYEEALCQPERLKAQKRCEKKGGLYYMSFKKRDPVDHCFTSEQAVQLSSCKTGKECFEKQEEIRIAAEEEERKRKWLQEKEKVKADCQKKVGYTFIVEDDAFYCLNVVDKCEFSKCLIKEERDNGYHFSCRVWDGTEETIYQNCKEQIQLNYMKEIGRLSKEWDEIRSKATYEIAGQFFDRAHQILQECLSSSLGLCRDAALDLRARIESFWAVPHDL